MSLRNRVDERDVKIAKLEDYIDYLKEELHDKDIQIERLVADLDELGPVQDELDTALTEIDTLEDHICDLNTQIEELKSAMVEAVDSLEHAMGQRD